MKVETKKKGMPARQRNTWFVYQKSIANYESAIHAGLMQVNLKGRQGKTVLLASGQRVTEFINCSYLGLDVHPKVVQAYQEVPRSWGVNFCCARSRFSIEPLQLLEEKLSTHFRGRAITFPTVTATHLSVMPLLARPSPKRFFIGNRW